MPFSFIKKAITQDALLDIPAALKNKKLLTNEPIYLNLFLFLL